MSNTNTEPEQDDNVDTLLVSTLSKHRKGLVLDACSHDLRQAIAASRNTGEASKVVITIKVKPMSEDQVNLDIQCNATLPKEKLPGGVYWTDDENNLVTSDPRQAELNLREVTRKPLRAAGE